MATTVANVLTVVRKQLNDTEGVKRWTNGDLIAYLNDAMFDLKNRPRGLDWLIKTDGTFETVAVLSLTGDTVLFSDDAKAALVHYVCWQALSEQDPDKIELAKAQEHWKKYVFAAGFGGKGNGS